MGSAAAPRPAAAAAARHGLFFAVYPDAASAAQLERLARQLRHRHGLKGRVIPAERLHLTLHHLGNHAELDALQVESASQAAAGIRQGAFELALDRVVSFAHQPRRRPLVLRVAPGSGLAALQALQQTLGDALKAQGLARWVAPQFTPHLTLLYDDRAVAEHEVETIRFEVGSFSLMHSHRGEGRHELLARWPLL